LKSPNQRKKEKKECLSLNVNEIDSIDDSGELNEIKIDEINDSEEIKIEEIGTPVLDEK
jgi:hypothetical protein